MNNFSKCDLVGTPPRNHMRRHCELLEWDIFYCANNTPEDYQCVDCIFVMNSTLDVMKHFQDGHVQINVSRSRFECGSCEFATFSKLLLETHQCRMASVQNYKSSIQDNQKTIQSQHICHNKTLNRQTTSRNSSRFQCEYCSYRTKQNSCLKLHVMSKHTRPRVIPWLHCTHCAYKGISKRNLRRHYMSQHASPEDIRLFRCDHCGYKTKQNIHLKAHVTSRHAASEHIPLFQCEHCSYNTNNTGHLRRHVMSKHTASEAICWLRCAHCTYKCIQKTHLAKHLMLKHPSPKGIRWFKCEHCEYQSMRQDAHANVTCHC